MDRGEGDGLSHGAIDQNHAFINAKLLFCNQTWKNKQYTAMMLGE